MGLFGAAKADPKKQVNEMSSLLRLAAILFNFNIFNLFYGSFFKKTNQKPKIRLK